MNVEGRVALVTGAAGDGMGRSIALTLAREGALVIVNHHQENERARAVTEAIEQGGGQAAMVPADVFTARGCAALFDAAITQFGRIDICVVNPGGGWHLEPPDQLDAQRALEDVHRELAPLFHLMPLILPGMVKRRWGRLIGVSLHPTQRSPAYAYNVGKSARTQALLLAQEEAWQFGVTINVVAPGPVDPLPSLEEAVAQCEHREPWLDRTNVSPQDVAEGVAFLCSDAGRFVTGCVLPYSFRP